MPSGCCREFGWSVHRSQFMARAEVSKFSRFECCQLRTESQRPCSVLGATDRAKAQTGEERISKGRGVMIQRMGGETRQHPQLPQLSAVSLTTRVVLKKSSHSTFGFRINEKDFKSRGRGLALHHMSTVITFLRNYSTALWAKKNRVCAAFQQPHSFLQ